MRSPTEVSQWPEGPVGDSHFPVFPLATDCRPSAESKTHHLTWTILLSSSFEPIPDAHIDQTIG